MINVKEYKGRFQVGDLIWFQKDSPKAYGEEDIGYIKDIVKIRDITRYVVFWFKPQYDSETRETPKTIRDMHNSYIIPVCKK